jgi:hypothetical protein
MGIFLRKNKIMFALVPSYIPTKEPFMEIFGLAGSTVGSS